LKIEFLEEYDHKENEKFKKYLGSMEEADYSEQSLFGGQEQNEPYTSLIHGQSIWPQIPLYNTSIILLMPIKKKYFKKVHGFDVSDINNLIDFSKESNRIRFALSESPILYKQMNYLEPIFTECRPPRLQALPVSHFLEKETESLLRKKYATYFTKSVLKSIENQCYLKYQKKDRIEMVKKVTNGIISDGIKLKLLGHSDEVFMNFLNQYEKETDSISFINNLNTIHGLMLHHFNSIRSTISTSYTQISDIKKYFPTILQNQQYLNIDYSVEIGNFLNSKTNIIVPKNLHGVIELNDVYDVYEIRRIMNILNMAIKKQNIDDYLNKIDDIYAIFNNIWEEATIYNKYHKISDILMPFCLCVLGTTLNIESGILGLLSGFALEGLEMLIAENRLSRQVSDNLLKFYLQMNNKHYVTHIYHFKKKYQLS